MRPASTRVASSWLRSRLRDASPRQARDRGLFDVHDDAEDDEDDDEPFDLFKRQPQSEAPKPEKKPKAPEKPRAPKAPSKPEAPAAKKPESGPAEGDMRRDPLFDKFVGEKYQGGEARVPNPNPDARERYPDVTFTTAMKDGGFRRKVHEEFERWKGEQKDKEKKPSAPKEEHKRLEVGQTIEHLSQLRVGDVIQSNRGGAPMRRIVSIHDGYVRAREVDDDGEHGQEHTLPANNITSGRHKRVEDPSSPEKQKERAEAKKRKEEEEKRRKDEARAKLDEKRKKNRAKSPAWAKKQDELLDLIHEDDIVSERRIGGEDNVNETFKRRLKLGDKEADFVWKPASGEHSGHYGPLRTGIEAGTYHQREAACYNIDRLLGEGTVVPPTATTGEGSYQAFQRGAHTFYDVYRGNTEEPSLSIDLADHPDFNRMNVLDLITGHEDRHIGNIMFVRDHRAPGGMRFIAIDNGLSLANNEDKSDEESYDVRNPWKTVFRWSTESVYDSTHDIKPELHAKVKEIDHKEFVDAMVDTGIDDESALLAALVRLSAIQRNPKILGVLDEDSHSEVTASIQRFLYMAGKRPEFLLEQAGDGPSVEELREVVRSALR